jgi:hypothetical protein
VISWPVRSYRSEIIHSSGWLITFTARANASADRVAAQVGFAASARSTHQLSAGQALVMVRISEGLLGRPVPSGLLPS